MMDGCHCCGLKVCSCNFPEGYDEAPQGLPGVLSFLIISPFVVLMLPFLLTSYTVGLTVKKLGCLSD